MVCNWNLNYIPTYAYIIIYAYIYTNYLRIYSKFLRPVRGRTLQLCNNSFNRSRTQRNRIHGCNISECCSLFLKKLAQASRPAGPAHPSPNSRNRRDRPISYRIVYTGRDASRREGMRTAARKAKSIVTAGKPPARIRPGQVTYEGIKKRFPW